MACGDQAVESRDCAAVVFPDPAADTGGESALADFTDLRHRLSHVDFDPLIELADRQRAELEAFRAHAGRRALDAAAPST